ncbi:MAG: hypothetical protein PHG99_05315 [Erysipelotrichaceae bacterium]|nr:hypothetical protein [Erysipelotrichaceae bacterium]
MFEIKRKEKTGVFFAEISVKEYQKYKVQQSEGVYEVVSFDRKYYYIISPRDTGYPNPNGKVTIEFDRYFKSDYPTGILFNEVSQEIKFSLNKVEHILSCLDGIIIKGSNYKINFSIDKDKLTVLVKSFNRDLRKMKLSSTIFNYIFFITGEFITQESTIVYKTKESNLVEHHFNSKINDYECKRFTRFLVPINKGIVEKTFPIFLELYNKNIYPIATFLETQTDIKYNIQQRVSLILNSLEGIIKRCIDKNKLEVPISKSNKRIILSAIKETVTSYLKSDDFKSTINNLENNENVDVVSMLLGTLGKFTEFSFNDILDISKEVNPVGYNFVKSIDMPTKFWKRCKDHRNFHAHLTEDNHKGFNGTQSAYAVFTLSTYFRLLVLRLSGFDEFEFENLMNESSSINEWLKNPCISREISKI